MYQVIHLLLLQLCCLFRLLLLIVTIMRWYDFVDTAYDRTLVQSVLSHAFESIENEHNEIVGQRGQMSEQRYNAYSILYNQAIEIAAKLDPFIAKNGIHSI